MTPKEAVLQAVSHGSKGVQIIADCVRLLHQTEYPNWQDAIGDLPKILDELIEAGEIVEVEYVLPGTDQIKSFCLPKGTEVRVKNG